MRNKDAPSHRGLISKPAFWGFTLLTILATAVLLIVFVSHKSVRYPDQNDPKNWPVCATKQAMTYPELYHCRLGD